MKKICLLACLVFVFTMVSGTAMADVIKGKVGVTGRLGFDIPGDGVFSQNSTLNDYRANAGVIFGGGFLYGLDQNWAAELDITNTRFDVDHFQGGNPSASIVNISLGTQYRFIPQEKLVPYIGFGLDVLLNDLDGYDVDTIAAGHVAGGVDYFLLKNLALNAEAKIVAGPEADIDLNGRRVGRFSTTNFSTTFGVRFFFN
ncbi:outer membrane beta-barrel protein [Geobacter sp. AOG1]|uniref:outer membrane beta-barrel protein n=1 Tax=Geobacter sp. AOG1 TaxID=1566346 RepID=UPI001CC446E0|nr:outer membrane beta-barrel protein [Geobacter sp. AOG1]GFE57480.1 outer membrane protein [Geobacter sp. AOG1]